MVTMLRMNDMGNMVAVKITKQEKARIASFQSAVPPQSSKDIEEYFNKRIPTLNQVCGQLLGHVPLNWTPAARASETDWSGTPLDPIFTHTGNESVAATLLGILIKDWFMRNAATEWYITDTVHCWRNIEVNTYLRLSRKTAISNTYAGKLASLQNKWNPAQGIKSI